METELRKVYNDGLYGYINEAGKIVVPFEFFYKNIGNPSNGMIRCVNKDGKVGYYDEKGNNTIPFMYDDGCDFKDNLASVCIGDKFGCIDKQGKEVIPFIYDDIDISELQYGYVTANLSGKYGIIDREGKVMVPFNYHSLFPVNNHNLWVVHEGEMGVSKAGLVKAGGEQLLPIIYDEIRMWGECDSELLYLRNSEGVSIIDTYGNIRLAPNHYTDVKRFHFTSHLWKIYSYDSGDTLTGVSDSNGRIILPCEFSEIEDLKALPNILRAKKKRLGWGVYNQDGEELLPCEYQDITNIVKIPSEVSYRGHEFHDIPCLQLSLMKHKKWGLYEPFDKKNVAECLYDEQIVFDSGYARIVLNGKCGLLRKDGKVVVDCVYDDVKNVSPTKNEVTVVKDGQEMVISICNE